MSEFPELGRWPVVLGVGAALLLASCAAALTSTPAPTQTAAPTPIPATAVPTVPPAADAILQVVLERAQAPDRVTATLFPLLTLPVAGGESVVFHFEDAYGEAVVGCSGHASVALTADGTREVTSISAGCGPTAVETPITVYPSRGVSASGEEVAVVYGEVYSADVVAIRVAYEGGEAVATIGGGAWIAELPLTATGALARAYDAAASVLYEAAPTGVSNRVDS